MTPILVTVPGLEEALTMSLIPALAKAYLSVSCPIKAVVLANPHNPLGRCYPKVVLEECLKFCHAQGIHLVSDEVFALSTFQCPDLPEATQFVSALSLNAAALGCDPSRVHAVWSASKDFGSSGIKLGCTATQSNENLRNALALAAHMNVSTLSAVFVTKLLASPQLPSLLALNSARLSEAYKLITEFFKRHRIHYFPCNSCPIILARVAPNAQSWDDEAGVINGFQQEGMLVAPGRRYHVHEKGWARICFAMERIVLEKAMSRMEIFFSSPA